MALHDGKLIARIAFWSRPGETAPAMLDIFDIDDSLDEIETQATGAQLIERAFPSVLPAGTHQPEYGRFLPADWRDDDQRRAMKLRISILEATGAQFTVERLRLEWLPESKLPQPDDRLKFRPVASDDELIAFMTSALEGTLDAHSREQLEQSTPEDVAAKHFAEEFDQFTSPREWWRIATLTDGQPVGFVIPARNAYHPIIAYLAVLPHHRGSGYIDGILAEGTRVLADAGVDHVRASTDLGNTPMAEAFERAKYRNFERTVNMSWPGK